MKRRWPKLRTPITAQLLRPDRKPHGYCVSDPEHVFSRHLVGDWVFNESSGLLVRDASGNWPLGTINGGTWNRGNVRLDTLNSDTVVLIPDQNVTPLLPRDEVTVVLRHRKTDSTARAVFTFGGENTSPNTVRCTLSLFYSAGSKCYWDFGGSTDGISRETYTWTGMDLDAWHTWAVTAGPRGMEIFLNGRLVASHSNNATRTFQSGGWGLGLVNTNSDLCEFEYLKLYNKQLPIERIKGIMARPYANLKEPFARRYIYGAVVGEIVQVPAGSITLTGQAPSAVTTEKHISELPAGAIAFTGQVPQIVSTETAANTSELPAGSIAFTGQTPSVVATEKHISELPAGSIALTGQVPSVSDGAGEVAQLPAGSIAFTGQAPQAVTTEKHISALPAGSIALTGQAPQIVVPNDVQLPAGVITLIGRAPAINDGATPPIPYEIGWTGGGRVMRDGVLPEWWENWEEPQPQEAPPTDDQIADLIAGLSPDDLIPPAPVLPRLRRRPETRRRIQQKAVLIGHPPAVISTRRRTGTERAQRKVLGATLLLLLRKR